MYRGILNKISLYGNLGIPNAINKMYLSIPYVNKNMLLEDLSEADKQRLSSLTQYIKKSLKDEDVEIHKIDDYGSEMYQSFDNRDDTFNHILVGNKSEKYGAEGYAHELGHIKVRRFLNKYLENKTLHRINDIKQTLFQAGPALGFLGSTAAALMGADTNTVRNIGLLGTVSTLPTLADEAAASYLGAKHMDKHNIKYDKIRNWTGFPTYFVSAVTPLLPWLTKKMIDSYKN